MIRKPENLNYNEVNNSSLANILPSPAHRTAFLKSMRDYNDTPFNQINDTVFLQSLEDVCNLHGWNTPRLDSTKTLSEFLSKNLIPTQQFSKLKKLINLLPKNRKKLKNQTSFIKEALNNFDYSTSESFKTYKESKNNLAKKPNVNTITQVVNPSDNSKFSSVPDSWQTLSNNSQAIEGLSDTQTYTLKTKLQDIQNIQKLKSITHTNEKYDFLFKWLKIKPLPNSLTSQIVTKIETSASPIESTDDIARIIARGSKYRQLETKKYLQLGNIISKSIEQDPQFQTLSQIVKDTSSLSLQALATILGQEIDSKIDYGTVDHAMDSYHTDGDLQTLQLCIDTFFSAQRPGLTDLNEIHSDMLIVAIAESKLYGFKGEKDRKKPFKNNQSFLSGSLIPLVAGVGVGLTSAIGIDYIPQEISRHFITADNHSLSSNTESVDKVNQSLLISRKTPFSKGELSVIKSVFNDPRFLASIENQIKSPSDSHPVSINYNSRNNTINISGGDSKKYPVAFNLLSQKLNTLNLQAALKPNELKQQVKTKISTSTPEYSTLNRVYVGTLFGGATFLSTSIASIFAKRTRKK